MADEEMEGPVTMDLTLRSSEDSEKVLRQIVLGYKPMCLIEPEYDEETDGVNFKIDATDIQDQEELAELFEALAHLAREGREV